MPEPSTRIAYADCFSGVSGDMFLGGLLDAGLDEAVLRNQLALVDLALPKIMVEKVSTSGLRATRFQVGPDNDSSHRSWRTIKRLLSDSRLPDKVKIKALAIFGELARAEAKVHGCAVDEVHFHEVGGLDAIVDIVGAAIGLAALKINRLIVSPLPMPHGWVQCAHGSLPLPAPAVCEILTGVPVHGVDLDQELVTPTGAAILKAMGDDFGDLPPMTIQQVGYGAGGRARSDNRPNLLRLLIGEPRRVVESQEIEVIETNLDDWSPETAPFLYDKLFANGALDVALVPIQMKKGRPGFQLQVLAEPARAWEIKQCILSETTAIGLRFRTEKRLTLSREPVVIETRWGKLQAKQITTPTGKVIRPEYEECRRLAETNDVPLHEVYAEVTRRAMPSATKQGKKTCTD